VDIHKGTRKEQRAADAYGVHGERGMKKMHALMAWLDELILNSERDERELFSVWQNLQGELMRHFGFEYSERTEEAHQKAVKSLEEREE